MSAPKVILAVVGLAGAGKSEAIDYLVKKTKLPKVYFGGIVIELVKAKGWKVNEINERKAREQLRAEHGMAAMAIASLPKIRQSFAESSVLIESLYSWEEYAVLKNEFGDSFKVLAIYASTATRIARLENRPFRPLTATELLSRDKAQIENLHQAGPIAKADWTIINESSREALYRQLDAFIAESL